ncbi:MAG TPA: BTAD domain-containing putative transcriptional regulator [Solirubrobacteraceae bacterium]|nr:BTAD domain-containing putative transcriptional regulator [Solirubrobacteraceae bacterium]
MEVRLFGELEAVRDGVAVPVRGAKQRALLALLALHRGKPVSVDRLIDNLWDEGQVTNPANALQAQIGQLRRSLGTAAIVTTEAGYALEVGPDDVDVVRFEKLVATGRRLVEQGEVALASTTLGEALALRRGEPLAEFAYAGFADVDRAHLDELIVVAVEARAGADLALGLHGELVEELEALCRDHPLRERLWELLILALYRGGRQAEALSAYTQARDRLVEELGIEPGPALRELQARVLAQDPALTLPGTPPPRVAGATMAAGNLRAQLSRFIGRDAELEQLCAAVRSHRLVTLIGPGGAGKTRLAVEAAAVLRDEHRDGAWLVELADVAEPDGVGPAAAVALQASASAVPGTQPAGSTVELIARHLAGRSLVVVLDNCEHVIDQAAVLGEALVGAVNGVRVIATSREPLGVSGEVLVDVGGLAQPAAVELFVDRARAVRPGFAADDHTRPVIEDICRRLDGLPLAVELAAARLRALTLATVAERLEDRFRLLTGGARTALPRQQTLRAVVDWSYDLLFDDERRLFARLAVFAGGCELTSAEAVCADDDVPREEILDLLSRLVDKSLLTATDNGGETRFAQLQTLWQYGRERLGESGEAGAVRARHGAYYRQMALDANQGLRGRTGLMWRDRLTVETGNLRTALDWFIATGDPDAALSLTSGIAWLWWINTDFAEGARWLDDALEVKGDRRVELAATAHGWHGYCVGMSSSPAAGAIECAEAVAQLRGSDDRGRLAELLVLCATVLVRTHEYARSLEMLGEAHDLLEPDGHRWLLGAHDLIVAWNLASLGRPQDAEPAARSSLKHFEAEGDDLLVVSPLNALAGIAEARGDLNAASAAYETLLDRCRATGQRLYVPFALVALAGLRARQGDDALADRLYGEAIGICVHPWLSADAMIGQAAVARRLGDLTRARTLLEAADSQYREAGLPAGQPLVLAGLAWWALAAGHPDDATVFAAAAQAAAARGDLAVRGAARPQLADAAQAASAGADPATQLLADTAVAAAKAIAVPTAVNVTAFLALAQRRASGPAYRSLVDEPDVAALAVRLAAPTR